MPEPNPRRPGEPSRFLPAPSAAAEECFVRFMTALELGQVGGIEEWCARHPEHADDLRRMHLDCEDLVRGLKSRREDAPGETATRFDPALLGEATRRRLEAMIGRSGAAARYETRDTLGRGGMGEIRRAFDARLRRSVAQKRIRDDRLREAAASPRSLDDLVERFLQEAQVTAQLDHPGVVPVHDFGVDDDGRPFISMAEVRGRSLHDVFALVRAGEEGWNLTRAIGVLERVCQTMAYAHSKGVIHRDLKPANVMVGTFGEVVVMDWGLAEVHSGVPGADPARVVQTDRRDAIATDEGSPLATRPGHFPGTAPFMAPERVARPESPALPTADVYSVGAILYTLLANRAPYDDTERRLGNADLRKTILERPPAPVPRLAPSAPAELVAICEKAMARTPAARYPNMESLAADLRAYVENRVVAAYEVGAWAELKKWVRRNRKTAAGWATTVALALGSAAGFSMLLSRENLLARERLQSTSVQASESAAARGDWNRAIEHLTEARELGYADDVGLRVLEARYRDAMGDRAGGLSLVAGLVSTADLGAWEGEVRLLEAEFALGDFKGAEIDPAERARAAIASGLTEPDRHYALALLAPTIPEAIAEFDRCLDLSPFHHGARVRRLSLLLFCGRFDDAVDEANALAALFPSDPNPFAVRGLVAAVRGDRAESERSIEAVRERISPGAAETLGSIAGFVSSLEDALPPSAWIGGTSFGHFRTMLGMLTFLAQAHEDPSRALVIDSFNLPCLREGTSRLIEGLSRFSGLNLSQVIASMQKGDVAAAAALCLFPSRPDFPAAEKDLRRAAEVLPDGLVIYFHAASLLNIWTTPEEKFAGMREACARYDEAARTPSLVRGTERAARFWSIRCADFVEASTGRKEPELDERLQRHLDWFADLEGIARDEAITLAEIALRHGHAEAARSIARHWRDAAPHDLDARLALARAELAARSPFTARDEARAVLAAAPGRADARDVLEQAEAAILAEK